MTPMIALSRWLCSAESCTTTWRSDLVNLYLHVFYTLLLDVLVCVCTLVISDLKLQSHDWLQANALMFATQSRAFMASLTNPDSRILCCAPTDVNTPSSIVVLASQAWKHSLTLQSSWFSITKYAEFASFMAHVCMARVDTCC